CFFRRPLFTQSLLKNFCAWPRTFAVGKVPSRRPSVFARWEGSVYGKSMPPPYERHVFVCINRRAPGDPKGCCAEQGSEQVHSTFKGGVARRGLRGRVRVNSAGCLDACALGVSVVIYPEGVWYGGVKPEDVNEIIEQHLIGGRPVERLFMRLRPP